MKIYKCDYCGREEEEPYGYDLFNEGGWCREWYDNEGQPVVWEEDTTSNKFYTRQEITNCKHFCPQCMYGL